MVLRHEQELGQDNKKEGRKVKKHNLPKRAVTSCFVPSTREKIGQRKAEWRTHKATCHSHICTSMRGEVHLTQLCVPTQQTATPESLSYAPLAVFGKKQEHYESDLFQISA